MWEQNGWLGSKINAASGTGDVTMDGQFAGAGGIERENHRGHVMELPLRTGDLPRLAREASSDTISAFSGAPPRGKQLVCFFPRGGNSSGFFYLRLNMSMMAARMASLLLLLLLLASPPPPPPTILRGGFPPESVRIPVVVISPPYFCLSAFP